ncbi:MAG: hypothetical protein HY680_06000 [Chloroflexi bacterium]|nr:hypothetical protein [Chloroflexota bacterium]
MTQQWIWCLHCERAFAVELGRKPDWQENEAAESYGESAFDFAAELESQLGVRYPNGQIYADCPYDDCDGDLKDFWWWERFREDHPDLPAEPESGKVYPLYPEPVHSR